MDTIIPIERRHPRGTRVAVLNNEYVGRVVLGPCTIIGTRDTLYVKNIYDLQCDDDPDNSYSATHKKVIPWRDDFIVGTFLPGHTPRLVREGLYRPGDNVTLTIQDLPTKTTISGGPYAAQYIAYEVDKRTPEDINNVYKKYEVYWESFLSHDRALARIIAKRRAKLQSNAAHAAMIPVMKTMWKNKIGSINFRNAPVPPKSLYRKAVNAVSSRLNRGVEVLSEKLFPFQSENNNEEEHGAAVAAATPMFQPPRHLPNSLASKIANYLVEPQAAAQAKVRNITRNLSRQERMGIQLEGGRRRTLKRRKLKRRTLKRRTLKRRTSN